MSQDHITAHQPGCKTKKNPQTNGSQKVADVQEKERVIKLTSLGLLKEKYSFRARRLHLMVMMNVLENGATEPMKKKTGSGARDW